MRILGNGKKPTRKGKLKVSDIEDRIRQGKGEDVPIVYDEAIDIFESSGDTEYLSGANSYFVAENAMVASKSNTEIISNNTNVEVRNTVKLEKMSFGRVAGIVFSGILSSVVIAGVCYGVYYHQVRYPRAMEYDMNKTGIGGINRWVSAIKTLDNTEIGGITHSDSYLSKEVEYANTNEKRINFFKKVVDTVSYISDEVEAKNKYGNVLLDKNDKPVLMDSLVNDIGEEVALSFIDYKNIPLDEGKIKEIMKEQGVYLGVADYPSKLVDVFCDYIVSLEDSDIPLKEIRHIPSLLQEGDMYNMTEEEDIFLDKLLFSSEDFYYLLGEFSAVAGGSDLQPLDSWVEWHNKPNEEKSALKEPLRFEKGKSMDTMWCGSYYLLNEPKVNNTGELVDKSIEAEVGDGTKESPAKIGTGVVTSIYVEENGSRVAKPVKVKLIDYKISQKALDYFQSKDERNRGYDIKSDVQYISYTFEVTNLSNEELTIYDNSSLSDSLANLAPRTGTVYGLQNSVTIKPYETGIIESWGSSTSLNTKYLIWGSDFKREQSVVWFRVLAGDIDDSSENKGVTLNNKGE